MRAVDALDNETPGLPFEVDIVFEVNFRQRRV